jgi:hypothetical protein
MLMTHYQKKWVRVIGIKNISRINYKKNNIYVSSDKNLFTHSTI